MDFITMVMIYQMRQHSLTVVKSHSWLVQRKNERYYFRIMVAAMMAITDCSETIAITEIKKGLCLPEQTRISTKSRAVGIMREWELWLKSLDQPKWWQKLFHRREKSKSAQYS